jgi:hypothetical protein
VQVEFRLEVVVEHWRRDLGPAADLVDGRAVVAALGEDLGGRPLDHLAALAGGQSLACPR